MTKVPYDAPRVNEMQGFLEHIYNLYSQYPNNEFDVHYVYLELQRYGLKQSDIDINNSSKNVISKFHVS